MTEIPMEMIHKTLPQPLERHEEDAIVREISVGRDGRTVDFTIMPLWLLRMAATVLRERARADAAEEKLKLVREAARSDP